MDIEKTVSEVSENFERWHSVATLERQRMLARARKNCKKVDWVAMGFAAAKIEQISIENSQGINYAYTRAQLDYLIYDSYFRSRLNSKPKVATSQYRDQEILSVKGSMFAPGYEVWLKPGVSAAPKKEVTSSQQVGLVLGAGNQTFLSLSDTISMLYDWDCCCILKMHPVRSYAKAALEIILSEYIEKGFLRIMECAVEEAKSLINDERISRVHMTGGKGTHDAIVWGDLQGESRLTPKLNKPMTSELGCITPYIVASGAEWTAKQLQYQAQILVGPAIANSGCNCLSPKLVILDKDWPQYDAFIGAIKKVMDEAILLPAYYPGAGQRYDTFRSEYENEADATVSLLGGNGKNETKAKAQGGHTAANATIRQYMLIEIDDNTKNKAYALRNEPFAPILTVFSIRGGNDASEFLDKAVSFANESVFGTLSTSLILHPKVDKAVGDLAVARLRYGTIVVNGWSALAFNNYWGGHPSEELADIQSGKGFVNQTLDVDFNLVEKSVTRLPFKTILHEVQKPRDFRFQNPKFSKNLLHFMVKPKLSTFAPLLFYR